MAKGACNGGPPVTARGANEKEETSKQANKRTKKQISKHANEQKNKKANKQARGYIAKARKHCKIFQQLESSSFLSEGYVDKAIFLERVYG